MGMFKVMAYAGVAVVLVGGGMKIGATDGGDQAAAADTVVQESNTPDGLTPDQWGKVLAVAVEYHYTEDYAREFVDKTVARWWSQQKESKNLCGASYYYGEAKMQDILEMRSNLKYETYGDRKMWIETTYALIQNNC